MLQEHVSTEHEVRCVLKPSAALTNVAEDVVKLGNVLTKQDHIILIQDHTVIMGGPGNWPDINYSDFIEKDMNFTAERTNNTNAWFVNLFKRYDKVYMNSKVRSVNLSLDCAQMGRGMSHIDFIYITSIVREQFRTHGLHLNFQSKRKLIAKSQGNNHVSGINSIPVITSAGASSV
jgi:hypothetical protein